jgi:hypothetical protein
MFFWDMVLGSGQLRNNVQEEYVAYIFRIVFFYLEEGGSMILQNVGINLPC